MRKEGGSCRIRIRNFRSKEVTGWRVLTAPSRPSPPLPRNGLSMRSCPLKEKDKADPNASSNSQPSPKSSFYSGAGSESTHRPSQSEARSSGDPSTTCTSIATLTSVSCAIAGSSSPCTKTHTTIYGCNVTGSLVSTGLCAA